LVITAAARTTQPAQAHIAKSLTLAAMSLGFGVVQLDVTIVNVALNSMGASLGGGVDTLQWIVSAYTIAFAALILTAGALGDRIGAKRVFIAGFAIFTAASLGCALAHNIAALIIARCIQGMGAAVLVPSSLALLNHAYPKQDERGRAIAIWAAGASLALTAGPLAGGVLIALSGWRAIFLFNIPIGLVGLGLAWRYASETPRSASRSVDIAGQVTGIVALGSLAAALIEGGARGWKDSWVLAGFGAFLVLAALFVLIERRSKTPMLPLSLFKKREFSVTAFAGLLVNSAFYGLIFVFSLYFQRLNHMSALRTGLAFVPMTGAVFAANLVAARIAGRIGTRLTIAIGEAVVAVGAIALLGITQGAAYAALWPQLLVMGAGLGLLVPPLTSALLGSVDKAKSGIASGVLNSMRQTGSVLGIALFGSFIGRPGDFMSGMKISLAISAALLIAGALAIFVGLAKSKTTR
jgi:MFS transporter, DHA2 family, methylenomycin A resistance protein